MFAYTRVEVRIHEVSPKINVAWGRGSYFGQPKPKSLQCTTFSPRPENWEGGHLAGRREPGTRNIDDLLSVQKEKI